MAKKNLCEWHTLNERIIKKYRGYKITSYEEKIFLKNLHNIGYSKISKNNKVKTVMAFQRKYRQSLINGKIDKESYLICKNILKL